MTKVHSGGESSKVIDNAWLRVKEQQNVKIAVQHMQDAGTWVLHKNKLQETLIITPHQHFQDTMWLVENNGSSSNHSKTEVMSCAVVATTGWAGVL